MYSEILYSYIIFYNSFKGKYIFSIRFTCKENFFQKRLEIFLIWFDVTLGFLFCFLLFLFLFLFCLYFLRFFVFVVAFFRGESTVILRNHCDIKNAKISIDFHSFNQISSLSARDLIKIKYDYKTCFQENYYRRG